MTATQLAGRIAIRVHGTPVPQGSKTASVIKGRAILRDANATNLKAWRTTVRTAAEDQCRYHDTIALPCRVWVRFTFTRPASHYRTGRNSHLLKDTAPRFPIGRGHGDIDKLQRAVFDALSDAKVWVDDSYAVDVRARKVYAGEDELALDRPGVDIIIEPLEVTA